MRCFQILALGLLGIGSQLASASLGSDLRALGLSPGTEIGPPSDPAFTQRWSNYNAPDYVIAVKPVTEKDVAKIIKFAATSRIPLLTTGGGHGYPITIKKIRRGIELDMANFNKVLVDANADKLTIGGGVRFGDLVGPMAQAKKEIPTGADYCVGMIGATLGGGVSRFNGLHGMIVDSLSRLRIVTAAGNIVTASKTINPDLFWGMRGAGHNYGTVVEATYDIYDETASQVLSANFLFPVSARIPILRYFKSFGDNLPAKLSFLLHGTHGASFGGPIVMVNAVYAGPQAEGQKLLQPLFDLKPTRTNLTMIPWTKINAYAFFNSGAPFNKSSCSKNATRNIYGGAVKHFNIPTFDNFYSNYDKLIESMPEQLDGSRYFVEFVSNQAVQAVPVDATSYPWRDITAHLVFSFGYDASNKSLDTQVNNFLKETRKNFTATSGFPQPQLYVSYGHGDEDLATLYSRKNLPKLKALKAKWDPTNFYRYYHSLV